MAHKHVRVRQKDGWLLARDGKTIIVPDMTQARAIGLMDSIRKKSPADGSMSEETAWHELDRLLELKNDIVNGYPHVLDLFEHLPDQISDQAIILLARSGIRTCLGRAVSLWLEPRGEAETDAWQVRLDWSAAMPDAVPVFGPDGRPRKIEQVPEQLETGALYETKTGNRLLNLTGLKIRYAHAWDYAPDEPEYWIDLSTRYLFVQWTPELERRAGKDPSVNRLIHLLAEGPMKPFGPELKTPDEIPNLTHKLARPVDPDRIQDERFELRDPENKEAFYQYVIEK